MRVLRKIILTMIISAAVPTYMGCDWVSSSGFSASYHWGSHRYGYTSFLINSKQDFEDTVFEEWMSVEDFSLYNDEFFSGSSLIAIFVPIGSGSIKLKVKEIKHKDGKIVVHIDKYSPQMQTCDMSYWLILVNPYEKIPVGTEVGFSLREVSKPLPDLRHK